MTHSKIASLLMTGALAFTVPAFAQSGSGSGSSAPSTPASTAPGQADRQAPSATTPLPPSDPAMPSTDATPRGTTRTSPNSSTTSSTTAGSANASNANANADLNANAGFYGPGASQFKNIDTDADGRISRAEFTTSASTAASLTLDTNRDGTVSTEERTAGTTGEKKHWWSRSEKASGDTDPAETFTKLDADNDGFLSENELASANAKLKK